MASLDDAAFHMYLGHIWARIGIGGALPELALGPLVALALARLVLDALERAQ